MDLLNNFPHYLYLGFLILKYFQIQRIAPLFTCLFLLQKSLWCIFGHGVLSAEPQMFQWGRRGDLSFSETMMSLILDTMQRRALQFSVLLPDMYKIRISLRKLDISEEARWIFSINIPSFSIYKEWWRAIILLS